MGLGKGVGGGRWMLRPPVVPSIQAAPMATAALGWGWGSVPQTWGAPAIPPHHQGLTAGVWGEAKPPKPELTWGRDSPPPPQTAQKKALFHLPAAKNTPKNPLFSPNLPCGDAKVTWEQILYPSPPDLHRIDGATTALTSSFMATGRHMDPAGGISPGFFFGGGWGLSAPVFLFKGEIIRCRCLRFCLGRRKKGGGDL